MTKSKKVELPSHEPWRVGAGAFKDGIFAESLPPIEYTRELLLTTIKNAPYITKELQHTVAHYVDTVTAPRMMLKTTEELKNLDLLINDKD